MVAKERFICDSNVLANGGDGVRFEVGLTEQPIPAFVIRHQGKPYAFLNRCGHVPVEIDWQQGKFFDNSRLYLICATHGAMYAPNSGRCVTGRCAGKGLTPLKVNERDNQIFIVEEGK